MNRIEQDALRRHDPLDGHEDAEARLRGRLFAGTPRRLEFAGTRESYWVELFPGLGRESNEGGAPEALRFCVEAAELRVAVQAQSRWRVRPHDTSSQRDLTGPVPLEILRHGVAVHNAHELLLTTRGTRRLHHSVLSTWVRHRMSHGRCTLTVAHQEDPRDWPWEGPATGRPTRCQRQTDEREVEPWRSTSVAGSRRR